MRDSLRSSGLRALQVFPVALLLFTPPTQAMMVVQRDFPELVARAEQIAIGTVTDIRSGEDASGAPMTFVTFSGLTVLKGQVDATLTLRFYGGTTGKYTVQVSDMPTFTTGERDVLFVAGNNRDVCPLVGAWQGRFHVRFDPGSATEVVDDNDANPITQLSGRELIRTPLQADTTRPTAMTLDAFRQLIANELSHPQAGIGQGSGQ